MDRMQKWKRNVRVRKYPDKRVDYIIAHRTTLSPPNELRLTLSAQVEFPYITSIKELNQFGTMTELPGPSHYLLKSTLIWPSALCYSTTS